MTLQPYIMPILCLYYDLYYAYIMTYMPNVYKSCPNMIPLEKLMILAHLQNLPKNVGDLGKLIVAKGFKKLPKVQKIAKSGHTAGKLIKASSIVLS